MKELMLLSLSIILMATAAGQHVPQRVFNDGDTFELRGTIDHYHPTDRNRFITLSPFNLSGESKDTSILIDEKGNFKFRLFKPYEGDIALIYNDEYITLYITPSEKINIVINDSAWKTTGNKLNALTITGRSAGISRSIIDYQYFLDQKEFNASLQEDSLTDERYALKRIARMREELSFLELYIEARKPGNTIFEQWCKNDIRYRSGKDIAINCFSNKLNDRITHQKLMALLKDFSLDNPKSLNSSEYYDFIRVLSVDFMIIVNINKALKEAIKQQGNNRLAVCLGQADLYTKGLARELMYYNIYLHGAGLKEVFSLKKFEPVVKEPLLKTLLVAEGKRRSSEFRPYHLAKKIREFEVDDSLKIRLLTILESLRGRYVFIDFWGNWCAPCMAEMPFYPKLMAALKDKPVDFVFFAVRTEVEEVEEVKQKYNIKGRFIALTGNEVKVLNSVMGFQSYPRHFLVNADGEVVDEEIDYIERGGELDGGVVEGMRRRIGGEK